MVTVPLRSAGVKHEWSDGSTKRPHAPFQALHPQKKDGPEKWVKSKGEIEGAFEMAIEVIAWNQVFE